jgi:hypothetical protein
MSVPSNHPIKTSKQSDIWRRAYIRLLTEEAEPWTDLTPEHIEELERIDELVQVGYMHGHVIRDAGGSPKSSSTKGPTLAGRIFAEEQQDILDRKSLWGRIKSGAGLFIGWLAGIISAVIVWKLTK